MINSHVQIPNCVLKQFRSKKSQTVFYLSLIDAHIHSCKSSRLGTEFGYYSEKMEKLLNREIESPFSKLVRDINSFAEMRTDRIFLSDEDELTIKRYMTASMARSSLCFNSYMKSSISANLYSSQMNHDLSVYFSIQQNGGISPVIQNHHVHVIVNRCDRLFVVPRNCFYSYNRKTYTCYALPISPICVLSLVPEEYPDDYIGGDVCYLHVIEDADNIRKFNCSALQYELNFNNAFVASARPHELQELKQYLENISTP